VNQALDYAENTLGVHKVHDEAEALVAELDNALGLLDAAIDARRSLDEQIEDRHMELLIEERGKAADISQAAMDRRLKEVYHKDGTLKVLRSQRNAKAGEASGLELDIDYIKYRLKVKVARMEELGGYFQFLAAVKNAEPKLVQYAEASTPGNPVTTGGETDTTNEAGEQQ
jgi:hypothetical protein